MAGAVGGLMAPRSVDAFVSARYVASSMSSVQCSLFALEYQPARMLVVTPSQSLATITRYEPGARPRNGEGPALPVAVPPPPSKAGPPETLTAPPTTGESPA